MAVDFENWRDWANEEDEGMAEYEQYVEVSVTLPNRLMSMFEGLHILRSVTLIHGFPFQMIQDIGSKKGAPPAMDDLDDLVSTARIYLQLT